MGLLNCKSRLVGKLNMKIKIEVSGRHIHLSADDLEKLFGKNYRLTNIKQLSQTGEFACEEKILLKNGKSELSARVVGPVRHFTQVEIARSDADFLGLNPPRKLSGDLDGSLGVDLLGPKGSVQLITGLIMAKAHFHCDEEYAKKLGLKNNQIINVRHNNYLFENVITRVGKNFKPAMHIDVDEAVKAGIIKGEQAFGEIID